MNYVIFQFTAILAVLSSIHGFPDQGKWDFEFNTVICFPYQSYKQSQCATQHAAYGSIFVDDAICCIYRCRKISYALDLSKLWAINLTKSILRCQFSEYKIIFFMFFYRQMKWERWRNLYSKVLKYMCRVRFTGNKWKSHNFDENFISSNMRLFHWNKHLYTMDTVAISMLDGSCEWSK